MLPTCYTLSIRVLQNGYVNTDPGAYSIIFCRLAWFTSFSLRFMSAWLIVLACIDRYLISSLSATTRMWSNLRIANRLIIFTVIIAFAVYIHIPILFQIGIKSTNVQPACYPTGISNTYPIFTIILSILHENV